MSPHEQASRRQFEAMSTMGAQRKRDSFFLTLGTEKVRGREL